MSGTYITPSNNPTSVSNGLAPSDKQPKLVVVTCDFGANGTPQTVDLTNIQLQQKMTAVQSIKIDNSQNNETTTVTSDIGDIVSVPAYYVGNLPIACSSKMTFSVASTGTGYAKINFCNYPQSPQVYDAGTNPNSSAYTPTDRSGSITTGGTAQVLMASNTSRRGYWVQNTSSTTLWINELGSDAVEASPSIELVSGAMYGPDYLTTDAISIIGATTGQTFTAREYT